MISENTQVEECTCGHCGHRFEAKPEPKHLLIVGDCTDAAVVERVMGQDKAEMVWTDPPYGVSYGDKLEASNPMGYRVRQIENDSLKPEELEEFIRSCFRICAEIGRASCRERV